MKKIIYLSLILSLFLILFSCESTPKAHFFSDTIEPDVGQEVFFTNNSENAKQYEWDFGDGYISNDEHPSHIYTGTGTYEVTLTAISKNGLSDKAALTLEVMVPTLLEIEVVEWNTNNMIVGASVLLYPTITDWDDETNVITEGFTNSDGIVVFSHLDPFVHYVDVWAQFYDNYTLRNDDIAFIRTPEIWPHYINRFTAWVDYVDHGKGAGRGPRDFIIRKLERKATDVKQPEREVWTQEWQDLYNLRNVK